MILPVSCPFPIKAKSLELINLYNYHLMVSVDNVLLFFYKKLSLASKDMLR